MGIYVLTEGNVAVNNDSWLGGGGFGYRQVVNNEYIVGGYALADYSNTVNNNGFWIANPGLEMLGQLWDININGYIPFGKKKRIGEEMWADDLFGAKGLNPRDYIRFIGHDEYAHKFKLFEEAANGFSFEAGRVVPYFTKAKLYLGGYHFSSNDAGVTNGAEARLTYGLNEHTALEVKNTYDNANHNQTLLGVRLTFGSYSAEQKKEFGISSRLMDPVDNDFARLNGGAGVLTKQKYSDQGEYHEHDNLWFFEPASQAKKEEGSKSIPITIETGDGTYEHPFVGFDQVNYNNINPNIGTIDKNPLMYFAPGSYAFTDFKYERLFLNSGWGMYGRTADYKARAMANERPLFNGGIDLISKIMLDNGTSTLDSIRVVNSTGGYDDGDFSKAALVVLNSSVILQNSDIENNVNNTETGASAYAYGIYANNGQITLDGGNSIVATAIGTAAVKGDDVYADAYAYATGIDVDNQSTLSISGSNTITANATGGTTIVEGDSYAYADAGAYGIDVENQSTLSISGSNTITANAIGGTATAEDETSAYGIYVDNSTINFKDIGNSKTSITVKAKGGTGTDATATSTGIYLNGNSNLQIDGIDVTNLQTQFGDNPNFAFINNSPSGYTGYKIQWDSLGTLNW